MTSRTVKITAAAVTVLALGAATAMAYWTTTGTGTGTATTSSGTTSALAVTDNSSTLKAMYPGDSAQSITATVTNNGSANYTVSALTAYLTVAPTTGNTCDATNYLLNGSSTTTSTAPVAVSWTAVDLAPTKTQTATLTIQFNNKTTNQDGCKGATVTIHYAAS